MMFPFLTLLVLLAFGGLAHNFSQLRKVLYTDIKGKERWWFETVFAAAYVVLYFAKGWYR
jgi:hypothetical protein